MMGLKILVSEFIDPYTFTLNSIRWNNLEGVKLGLSLIDCNFNIIVCLDYEAYQCGNMDIKNFLKQLAIEKGWWPLYRRS